MNTIAHSFPRLVAAAALLVCAQLMMVPAADAGPNEDARGLWLASAGSQPIVGTNWGRLALRDGVLTFSSPNTEWQLALSEITRVAIGESSNRLMVIEGAGRTYYVAILGQQMLVESPRQAVAMIQKAMTAPAVRRGR